MSKRKNPRGIMCDECGEVFERNIHEFPLANKGVRQALMCPFCKRQYPICVITPFGLILRKRLSRMRRLLRANNQLPGSEYHDLLAQYRNEVTPVGANERRERAVTEARQGNSQ